MNVHAPVKTSTLETGKWTGRVSVAEAERIANTIRPSWDLPSASDPPSEMTDPSIEILDSSITRLPVEKAARNPYVWGLVGGVLLVGGIGIWMSRSEGSSPAADGLDQETIAAEPARNEAPAPAPSATQAVAPAQAEPVSIPPNANANANANAATAQSQPSERPAVAETPVPAPTPRPPVRVAIRVAVQPASARLELDGARVPSPYSSQIERGRRLVFAASAPGYERLERIIDVTSDVQTVLALVAIPPAPRPVAQAQRPRPTPVVRPRPNPTKVQRPPTGRNSTGSTTFSSDNPYDE